MFKMLTFGSFMNPERQRNGIFRGKGNKFMLKGKAFFFFGDYEIFFSASLPPIYSNCIYLRGQKGEVKKQGTKNTLVLFFIFID